MIERYLDAIVDVVYDYVQTRLRTVTNRIQILEERAAVPGPQGPQGETGPQGERGLPGESIKGDTGPQGPQGERGLQGEPGPQGLPGESIKGDTGERGPQGERGLPGESIKGDTGERGESIKGDTGERGPQGERGLPGETGPQGIPGLVGERGEKGIDGKDGRDGRDGIAKDGRDGEPGKDALQIEILSSMDPARSYPRGTFMAHDGGIIRASRHTDPLTGTFYPLAGWDVVVNGIAAFEVSQDEKDMRRIWVKAAMTGGDVVAKDFRLPLAVYQGVFDAKREYEQGDTVTFDGCVWHCQAEKTSGRPGQSEDWKMMVRRGNDGKSEKQAAPNGNGPVRLK